MLPIALRPDGRRAVIVGGGDAALRKAETLAAAGFPIFVVATRIANRLRALLAENGGTCAQRPYASSDVENAMVVVAATDDGEVNERVAADARAAHALICDAAQPERGDFTMAATARIGDLTISVDSNGAAPAFSRRVVRELAQTLGPSYADAVRTLARMRTYVKETFAPNERAHILRELAALPIDELSTAPASVVCATRESALAMVQSRAIAARLAERGVATTLLGITTTGDRDQHTPLDRLGSVNVFVKELENALREGRADYAVHSCKDIAGSLADDMRIAAISSREDARDAFCSERYSSFESLPAGALVGTSSPRRHAQLAAIRADLRYQPLRGNVDTRLRKLAVGEYDAIVIAMAGLKRLRASATHVLPFSIEHVVPAVGQGALAIETRSDADWLANRLRAAVNDEQSELCVACERAALRTMRAGCSAPLGIHATLEGELMTVRAAYELERGTLIRSRIEGPCRSIADAQTLGTQLAQRLSASNTAPSGVAS